MKVLQVHARYRIRGGEDSVVDNEAAALRRAGHDVHQMLAENPTGALAATVALTRSSNNRGTAAEVSEAIRAARPDVVHVHNTWFALSSSVVTAAASTGVPVVMTLHNYRLGCLGADLFRDDAVCTACVGRTPARGIVHGCYRGSRVLSALHATEVMLTRSRRVLDSSVQRFIIPSRFMADRLVDIGVPAERITVKAHFTTDDGPRSVPPSMSGDIVFVGRLAPGKGIDTLLDAWRLSAAARERRLVVIGDGPLADEVRNATPSEVDLVGWLDRDEVGRRLRSARALVMPTEWYEPFGMVLIEAMSAGLPIVTTTMAGGRAIVGGRDDLVVPPRRPDALAAALDALDDRSVDVEGAANRIRYEAAYTEQRGVADLLSVYESATRTPT